MSQPSVEQSVEHGRQPPIPAQRAGSVRISRAFLARTERDHYPAPRGRRRTRPRTARTPRPERRGRVVEQRELEQRVRSLYELARTQDPRVVERKTPAAALETMLR